MLITSCTGWNGAGKVDGNEGDGKARMGRSMDPQGWEIQNTF